jgi:S1-C subfamily serine protease
MDNNKYKCEVIGICPQFDIGLIKCIEYISDVYLELGDSDKLKVRSEVIVIGYPMSIKSNHNNVNNLKYTIGIINGQQGSFIQTDSAINPGNSGGPLIYNEKVIGINSQKLVGYSVDNIGFAVPINYYKIIESNFDKKIIYRPNLLFQYDNTDKNTLKILTNNKINEGILVSKIYELSCLKNSKIKEGSIITHINNIPLNNNGYTLKLKWFETNISLNVLMNKFKSDETITITYYYKNEIKNEKIKLKPYIPLIREIFPSLENINYFILGAMVFMDLTENILDIIDNLYLHYLYTEKFNLKTKKLIVSFIYPNSKVNILNNIKKYDIITKVNDIEIYCLEDFKENIIKPIIINNNKYIKITNHNNKSLIMSIKELYNEDLQFSNIYKYQLNSLYNKI